jgi:hypothetical protein
MPLSRQIGDQNQLWAMAMRSNTGASPLSTFNEWQLPVRRGQTFSAKMIGGSPIRRMARTSCMVVTYIRQIIIRPARDQLYALIICGALLAASGTYDAIGKPSAWPVVLMFALAWLLGGLYLQLRTITIDQDTLVSKGLFRDPIVIDRRDVSALELRFSAFQLENISSRRDEIVISRAGHQPVTMSLKSFSKSDAQTILTFFDNKIVNSHGQFEAVVTFDATRE